MIAQISSMFLFQNLYSDFRLQLGHDDFADERGKRVFHLMPLAGIFGKPSAKDHQDFVFLELPVQPESLGELSSKLDRFSLKIFLSL